MKEPKKTVMTLYPNSAGLGFVLCTDPEDVICYGMMKIRPRTKRAYLKRIRPYLEAFEPDLIVTRSHKGDSKTISSRICRVVEAIRNEAKDRKIKVSSYSRGDIKRSFLQYIHPTKHNINTALSTWYPELKEKQPAQRKNYDPEHYQTGLFDAFSLMVTHFTKR